MLLVSLGLGLFVLGCGFLCHLRASRAATHSRLRKFGAFKANSPTPISGGGGGSSASDQAARKGRAPELTPRSPHGLAITFHHTMAGSQHSGSKRDAVGQGMPRACVPASPVPSARFIELAFPYTSKSPPLQAGTGLQRSRLVEPAASETAGGFFLLCARRCAARVPARLLRGARAAGGGRMHRRH